MSLFTQLTFTQITVNDWLSQFSTICQVTQGISLEKSLEPHLSSQVQQNVQLIQSAYLRLFELAQTVF